MNCRICKNNELKYKYSINDYTFYKCLKCNYIQVIEKPDPKELNEIYSINYFTHSKYKDIKTLDKENQRRLNLINKYVHLNSIVLDYGCACGEFIKYIFNYYYTYGIDFSDYAIRTAKKQLPEINNRLSTDLIDNQDFSEEFFDAVVMWDLIEHLWDPLKICSIILKYIKKNGYLFISTPNIGSLIARITGKYWAFMTPPEHLGFFSKSSLNNMFENTLNCKIVDWKSKGKWVNIAFFFYKLKRIFPNLIPDLLIKFFQLNPINKLALYIPTGDIQYIVIKKI